MRLASVAAILLAAFGLLFLPGCLQKLSGGSSLYEQEYRDSFSRVPLSHPNMTEECKIGTCMCMVCKNGTNIFGPLESLIGGYCYWNRNCTAQTISDLNNKTMNPDLTIRQFMVGSGPTFGDFSFANTYCTDHLSMAVQWLLATNDSNYFAPDAARSMCMLAHDVIPVYILYSNGTNINNTRARNIGEILGTEGRNFMLGRLSSGPVGPVIVVTEIDFDKSNAAAVANQVRAIDEGCQNDRANNKTYCIIAVAPKINDFEALDAVMNSLGSDRDKVDLVAYGVNGKYVHSCDGARIRQQAVNFSSYALYNWSKPTIIPYVLFDPGTSDIDNSCNWTESDVVAAYASFSPTDMVSLQKRGVIGMAPYAYFNTTPTVGITNPLNCTDCGVSRSPARMASWFGGCQLYTNHTTAQESVSGGQTQIVFGNESGTICNQNAQFDFLRGVGFTGGDFMQQQAAPLQSPVPRFFACDACLLANGSRSFTSMFGSLNTHDARFPANDRVCKLFPEIEQWSSARNLDPMLVRAFVYTESDFDPCSAAKVCSAECIRTSCTDKCFPVGDFSGNSECYSKAYDEMYDPDGNCTFAIASNSGSARPDWRYCAVGLMQSLEPPWTFWPAQYSPTGQNGIYFDVWDRSGFKTSVNLGPAKGCNPNFNPFKASDSVCIGTAKIESLLRSAKAWINSHRAQLNWDTSTNGDFDKTNLFAAYVAANMYSGFWGASSRRSDHPRCSSAVTNGDCWAYGFAQSWAVNATYCASSDGASDSRCENGIPKWHPPYDCYGETDFLKFVQDCEVPFLPRQDDPGRNKIQAFIQLANGCSDYMCPDGKKLMGPEGMDRTPPASGVWYLPDSVMTPPGGTSTGGTSTSSTGGTSTGGTSSAGTAGVTGGG